MSTATGTSPEALRGLMVDQIAACQDIAPQVQVAMRKVPRHMFLPEASLEDAYADQAVNTKLGDDGRRSAARRSPPSWR